MSVHRADCANAVALMSDQSARLIEVEWDGDTNGALFRASVEVKALDRSRLLRDVSNALSEQHVNIVACSTHTGSDRVARMRFEFEMADPGHLDAVLRTIKNIDAVYDAYRIVPEGRRVSNPAYGGDRLQNGRLWHDPWSWIRTGSRHFRPSPTSLLRSSTSSRAR